MGLSGLGQYQSGVPFFCECRVSEKEILAGHFQATGDRVAAGGAPILMLHDTTEFTFRRNEFQPIGILHKSYMRKNKHGRPVHYTVCGILMHSSLAVTSEGLPLGLAAAKFWTGDEFKGCNALKHEIITPCVVKDFCAAPPSEAKEAVDHAAPGDYLRGRDFRRFPGPPLRLLVTDFVVLAASNNSRNPCANSSTAFSRAPSCPTRTIATDRCSSNDGGRKTFTGLKE